MLELRGLRVLPGLLARRGRRVLLALRGRLVLQVLRELLDLRGLPELQELLGQPVRAQSFHWHLVDQLL
ncbi:hypothetical protein D3C76_1622640 [compost metagenome]